MRLLKAKVENFGSYKQLEVDYADAKLTLLHGATGSGKSTFQDIPCWILYGITAKNGAADDVKNWSTDAITRGELELDEITVVRERGKPNQNDLYWIENNTQQLIRGKDAKETQKFLTQRLGCSESLYLATTYYSEFSPSAGFFMASANQRRELIDSIAQIQLPTVLAAKSSSARSKAKELFKLKTSESASLVNQLTTLERLEAEAKKDSEKWQETKRAEIEVFEQKSQNFEQEKHKRIEDLKQKAVDFENKRQNAMDILAKHMEDLDTQIQPSDTFLQQLEWIESSFKCPTCGGVDSKLKDRYARIQKEQKENDRLIQKFETAKNQYLAEQAKPNPYESQIELASQAENAYIGVLTAARNKKNPHLSQLSSLAKDIESTKQTVSSYKLLLDNTSKRISDLSFLYDLALTARGKLFQSACAEIENNTNLLLSKHFDAEIKVTFSANDSDNIDVQVFKDGYECSYKQLSKGQRGLLKLAFSLSVMKTASKRSNATFNVLFLDEALDGLDSDLKIKALGALEELQKLYESIYVVEHSIEFKSMVSNQIEAVLSNGESKLIYG